MAALGSPSEHPLFLVSLPGALDSLQLEIGGPCAHLVESVVAAENEKSLAVPEQVVEATHFGWQVIPQGRVVVAAIRYHWHQNCLEYYGLLSPSEIYEFKHQRYDSYSFQDAMNKCATQ